MGPLALGPRWLAYAAAEAPSHGAGRAAPQRLSASSSPGGAGSAGSGSAALLSHYARVGGKHLAAGVMKGARPCDACVALLLRR